MKHFDTRSPRFPVLRSLSLGLLVLGMATARGQVSSYVFDQGFATYASISATGTSAISGSWDNNVTGSIPLGFSFNFNGTNYTDCYINSNGYLTFGSASTASSTTPISSSTGYAGAVSAYGMDLIRSSASDAVKYQTIGSAPNRTFVAEWKNVRRRYTIIFGITANDALNFQIRLNETSNTIELRFGTCTQEGILATTTCQVGLRGSANTQYNNRTTTTDWSATTAGGSNSASVQNGSVLAQVVPAANLTLRWSPPTSCTTPSITAVPVNANSVSVSWTCAGCTGPFVVEYGPTTLLPGTFATAGQGGTVVSASASSPTLVSGLSASTTYKFAVRQACTGGQYTPNAWTLTGTPFDCSSATAITCGASNAVTLTGNGNAAYSTSAATCNTNTPGQERLYTFTTTYPGVNRLSITSHSGPDLFNGFFNYLDYQVAPAASGCSQGAYTCIGRQQATTTYDFTLAAGTYYLLVDAEQPDATTENFTIQCAAPPACVASPTAPTNGAIGLCQPLTLSWPAVTAFPAATGYDVYLNAGNAMPTTVVSSNQAGTSYAVSGLSAGQYSWKVVPRNASGAASGCTYWTFTVNPEPAGDRASTAITVGALPATINGNNRAANCVNDDFTTSSTPGNPNAKPGRDVFYKITTGSCTQRLNIGVCASSGGNSFLHLITVLGVNVANNDNAAPSGCANANSSSVSNVAVLPNTTYYIVVESTTLANEFDYTLTISEVTSNTDSDGDGTPDCADGCPADPNKVDPGVCGCGVADTDTDLDGVEDCFDECPNDPNKFEAGLCGCGNPEPGTPCDDGNACTANDIITGTCGCAGTPLPDSDGDGVCDAQDACPNDPLNDADGDGLCADVDGCPTVFGEPGTACDDGNPFTTNDVLTAGCTCAGTPVPSHNWTLRIVTDNAGNETTWEIRDVPTNYLMAGGGPYPNNSTVNQTVSIPDAGHFVLRVFDSGNNGIGGGGGYLLRDHNGNRVIDNTNNGDGFTSVSESPEGFYTPVGTNGLRAVDCDNVERWPFDMITAMPDPAVTAQWQVGNQTDDGYEFWFTDPNGSYSRHIFRNHATSGGYGPADATRACKLGLASWTVNPLPQDLLLNVRVRGRVNGVDQTWGAACKLKVDQAAANCHTTRLEDLPGVNFSCGVVGLRTDGSSRIWAKPVTRYVRATNTYIPANKYKFHFVNVGENTQFDIVQNSYPMLIYPQYGFQLGASYQVTVQASFDGGTTYCPVGTACQISFAATNHREVADVTGADAPVMTLWPNPNRGDQFYLAMNGLDAQQQTAAVDVVNMFGERVMARVVNVSNGSINTSLQLDARLASGLYLVNVTAGDRTITQRLVVQR